MMEKISAAQVKKEEYGFQDHKEFIYISIFVTVLKSTIKKPAMKIKNNVETAQRLGL
jgi:hypothetical protein